MVSPALIIMTIFIFSSAPASSQNLPTAKPNCRDRCGAIAIPYPFGTTSECHHHHPSFLVTCNDTHYNPPKLFIQNSNIEITEISLAGQMKALQFIARDCYARDGTNTSGNGAKTTLPTYLTFSNTANKFITVGCDTVGTVSGTRRGRNYRMACTAQCEAGEELGNGVCEGSGCCQTDISEGVSKVGISLSSINNYKDVWDFNNCGYAFVVEKNAFNFSRESLSSLGKVKMLPMVIDWAFGNGTCKEAREDSAAYGCKSLNSSCYKPGNISDVYRCRCDEGYDGNPYLVDGCRDINECAEASRNDCTKNIAQCQNIPAGNYTCSCPEGYSGTGRGTNGCTKKHDMTIAYILMGIAFGITAILLSAILVHMELKRRKSQKAKLKFFLQNGGMLLQEKLTRRARSPDMVRIFSSSELQKATDDFHNSMIIGQGGFGTVYKGFLSHDTTVAIKKSKKVDPGQIEQFINEVFVLSQVNHRNVVRLIGCCLETEVPLLVYEFIDNGTLSAHLHNKSKARSLNWEMRLRIAAETAGVLAYLHSSASTPIIHRDVKPENILLDHAFTAKVSDFGASKLVPLDLTQLSTMVQGTFGYLDPEYMQTNQLTEKSDVYSFGVVLLELLTGRKAISFDKPEKEKNLANFFLFTLKEERLFEILEESIAADGNMDQILEVSRLAKGCLNVKGEDRPSMKEVAMELEGLVVGRRQSWVKNAENLEEMESLLGEGTVVLNPFGNGNSIGNSSSIGYDSIRDHVLLPVTGGR